jgi:iron complex outermembrane recepter protein
LIILFFTAFTLGSVVHAQQDDEDVFQLEEITVTAEKRESDLQNTPLAISAISGDSFVKEQVNQMYELQKIVPEMDIFVGGASMTVISIRGVYSGDWSAASEQPNMVHLNGAVIIEGDNPIVSRQGKN